MIEIKNGSLTIADRQVFHKLSFSVKGGNVVGVAASQSVDATMLAECFIGLRGLSEGFVSVDGEPILPRTAQLFRPQIAYIPRCVRMPLETVAELFDTLIDLSVNDNLERPKKKMLSEWRKMGIGTELHNAKISNVDDHILLLMMLGAANISMRQIVLIDFPSFTMDDQQANFIASYVHTMAQNGRAILIVNANEKIWATCDKVINLDEYQSLQSTD